MNITDVAAFVDQVQGRPIQIMFSLMDGSIVKNLSYKRLRVLLRQYEGKTTAASWHPLDTEFRLESAAMFTI